MSTVDFAMSCLLSRGALGLDDLQINDFETYYVSSDFLGGSVTWNRTQVSSPWMDGQVTTSRQRGQVMENVVVEVLGETIGECKASADILVEAFLQSSYQMEITANDAAFGYQCETADYKLAWTTPRFAAHQFQVTLTVPRHPVALLGVL